MVIKDDILRALDYLGIFNKPVCIHSSLSSFGWVDGGADSIIEALLDKSCSILVPTFSSVYAVDPLSNQRPLRNGCDYSWFEENPRKENINVYTSSTNEVDKDMGAIPRAILNMQDRKRGNHPLNSFTAVGPLAKKLIEEQQPDNVYAPLKILAQNSGSVILMGVGLKRLTLIHLAEQLAGRKMFRRWAKNIAGSTITVEVGGCSEGFHNLDDSVASVSKEVKVGESLWRVFDAKTVLEIVKQTIQQNPSVTHCGDANCERCNDAVLGGPLLY